MESNRIATLEMESNRIPQSFPVIALVTLWKWNTLLMTVESVDKVTHLASMVEKMTGEVGRLQLLVANSHRQSSGLSSNDSQPRGEPSRGPRRGKCWSPVTSTGSAL